MAEECERKNKRGVIITTYVESSTFSQLKKDQIKRIKPKSPFSKKHRAARTHGYDRRAQLLAHAQQLRHPNSQQLEDWPIKNLRLKTKKRRRWSPSPARLRQFLCRLFDRTKRRWRYERVVSDGKGGSYSHEGIKRKKLKTNGIKKSKFCGRLRKLLKDLSSAWKCKRGGGDDGEN